ncbi:hypothetical protein H4R33_002387 [Dimargaris cristalligena]|nr:hypothetical protein H4R33_002387 [Dimargaris cristalligena]
MSADFKKAEVWWVPTNNDPSIDQRLVEEALFIYSEALSGLVNRRMRDRRRVKLVFRCGQEVDDLLKMIEDDVQSGPESEEPSSPPTESPDTKLPKS